VIIGCVCVCKIAAGIIPYISSAPHHAQIMVCPVACLSFEEVEVVVDPQMVRNKDTMPILTQPGG